jgi:hypothetical protein
MFRNTPEPTKPDLKSESVEKMESETLVYLLLTFCPDAGERLGCGIGISVRRVPNGSTDYFVIAGN